MGAKTVTYNVTDANGNNAVQVTRTVTVVDNTIPVITVTGGNVTIEAGTVYDATADLGATATDNLDDNAALTLTIVEGGLPVDTSTLGAKSVTYNVTDSEGNDAVQVVRTVTVVDTTIPVISLNGLSSITVEAGSVYDAAEDEGANATDNLDDDTALTSTIVEGGLPVDTSTLGVKTVTYDVTDSEGNDAVQVVRTVTVVDTTIPVISLNGLSSITVEAGSVYDAAEDEGANATDNLDDDTALTSTIVEGGLPVDTSTLGVKTVTYDVTDSEGNDAVQVTRTVTIVDTTIPVISLVGLNAITIEAGSVYDATVDAGASVTDNLDDDTTITGAVSVNGLPVDTSTLGDKTVTYDVTDANNNVAAQVIRTVTVVDTTPPVITINGNNLTVEAGTVYDATADLGATATDNFDDDATLTATIVENGLPVDTSTVGTKSVTYNVTDSNGNNAVQVVRTVTVVDTTDPVVTAPDDVTVEATAALTTVALGTATATDIVDGTVTVTNDAPATFPVGTTTVTYTATDVNGNTGTATQTITVVDTTKPVITLVGDNPFTIEFGATYVDPGANATDEVDDNTTLTAAIVKGGIPVNTSTLGNKTVTYNVTDTAGNIAVEVTRTVAVVDTTDPVVTAPANITIEAVALTTTVNLGTATANDNFDGALTPVATAPGVTIASNSGDFPVGVHTVTYTATDSSGNIGIATQTVTVQDTVFPVIILVGANPLNIEVGTTFNDPGAIATDAVDGNLPIFIGGDTVVTSGVGGPFDITYSATDNAGNTASINRTVNVVDLTAPEVTAAGDLIIEATGTNTSVTLINITGQTPAVASANDNIDGALTPIAAVTSTPAVTLTNNTGDFPIGVHTVTWSATDAGGNVGTATQTVTVQDTTGPDVVLIAQNNEIDPLNIVVGTTYVEPGATATDIVDNVLPVTIAGDTVDTSVVDVSFTVTYTATDNTGNPTTVNRVVNIVPPPDTIAPVITLVGDNPQTITVGNSYVELGATANDDIDGDITANILINPTNVNTAAIGTYSVTYDVVDDAGNPAVTQTRTVNVVALDNIPPTCTASAITVTATGSFTSVTLASPTATDNVGVTLIDNDAPLVGFPIGVTNVIWTVFDAAGNSGTCNQSVTVVQSQSNGDTRIVITSLPFIAEFAGSYIFASNLTHTTTDPGSCITINADNVTIDLNGFSLIGSGQTAGCDCHGISTGGKSNIKILNGTISDFAGNGIYDLSPNANGVSIQNITTASNGGHGIFLNGNSHTVTKSVVYNNLTGGVFVQNSSKILTNTVYSNTGPGITTENGATILTNTVYANTGAGISTINGSTLNQNTVYQNTGNGIIVNDGCTLSSNTVYENTGDGIVCNNGSTLTNNTVHNNTGTGIVSLIAAKVKGNTCYLNGDSGIVAGAGSMVSDNIVNGNNTNSIATQGGIFVSGNVTLKCNQVTNNAIQNILVTGDGNVLKDNTVNLSDIGINFDGSGFNFFSGNKASGNTTSGFSGTALPTGLADGGGNIDF